MIGKITGKVSLKANDNIIIDTSGVGYKIFVTTQTLDSFKEDEEVELLTHLIVRENALDLYGFLDKDELDLFELLLSVSGIGPKSALGILSITTPDTLKDAIVNGESIHLTKVSGVGKKIAGKIVLELKDKIVSTGVSSEVLRGDSDALEALVSMGYSANESRDALKQVPRDIENGSERLREALKIIGKVL